MFNTTSDGLIVLYPQQVYTTVGSGISLFVGILFTIGYITTAISLGALIRKVIKDKIEINFHAKIIFSGSAILILFQVISKILRFVADIIYIDTRTKLDNGQNVVASTYICAVVLEFLANICFWYNHITIIIMAGYIQTLFWKTVFLLDGISEQKFKVVRIVAIVGTVFFAFAWFALSTTGAILTWLIRVDSSYVMSIFGYTIACPIILACFFVFDLVSLVASGSLVLMKIKKMSKKQQKKKNPFIASIGLMSAMLLSLLSMFLEVPITLPLGLILSAVGVQSDIRSSISMILPYICNDMAALSFSIFSLALFYPMFVKSKKSLEDMKANDDTSSNTVSISANTASSNNVTSVIELSATTTSI